MNPSSSSSSNMDDFLNSLENLPAQLAQNLSLMRELDSRVHELMREIDRQTDDYMKKKKYLTDTNKESMNNIQRKYDKAKEYSDDKVQLAIQTYTLVDDYIRRLDSNVVEFNTKIKSKTENVSGKLEEASQKKGPNQTEEKENKNKKMEKGGKKTTSATYSNILSLGGETHPIASTSRVETGVSVSAGVVNVAQIIDMPVDPNEPKFCSCNQVSFGQMIGCDNSDCPIEWFHFECVKLNTKPKGKWFCPTCKQTGEKK